jgi:hypothetical protein
MNALLQMEAVTLSSHVRTLSARAPAILVLLDTQERVMWVVRISTNANSTTVAAICWLPAPTLPVRAPALLVLQDTLATVSTAPISTNVLFLTEAATC